MRYTQPPTDLRHQRKQYERRLLALTLFVLVVVGGALIGLFFGLEALLAAVPCLLVGAAAIAGLWLLMNIIERWLENR
ncbi:MAG: hypothetical protein JW934_05535 [Anaerolineae bacterium]|nr:hypothetical protein [Anaerolineae bacterium]